MEALIHIWAILINIICYILVAVSAPLAIAATVAGCLYASEEIMDRSVHMPSPAGWRKRKRWQAFSAIIFAGFILLNATFLLYAVFPWDGGLWGVFN